MLVRKADGQDVEGGPPCCIPGCTVTETGEKETCVIWGQRRLCYPHFARWRQFTDERRDMWQRAPTAEEWTEFLATLRTAAKGAA
jgi:hypothetical protein